MTSFAVLLLLSAEPPRGALIAVGGGSIDAELRATIIREAGGPKVRMLVAGQASSDPKADAETAAVWRKAGMQNVAVLELADAAKAAAQMKRRRRAGLSCQRLISFDYLPSGISLIRFSTAS